MPVEYKLKLDGADRVSKALTEAQKMLKDETVPVIKAVAKRVKSEAEAIATPHPSGLWRGQGKPLYYVRKGGEYCYKVIAARTAEEISEFTRKARTGRGRSLIDTLDMIYGYRDGGRILWRAMDGLTDELVDQIDDAIVVASRKIENKMGSA